VQGTITSSICSWNHPRTKVSTFSMSRVNNFAAVSPLLIRTRTVKVNIEGLYSSMALLSPFFHSIKKSENREERVRELLP